MKTLIISDTHLSHIFQPAKYEFLHEIISQADHVIINGDFWEGCITTFEEFVNSQWQMLFPLLRQREAIYLYGNHDEEHQSDTRRSAFSIHQADTFEIRQGGHFFHFEHGHQITLGGLRLPFPRFLQNLPTFIEAHGYFHFTSQPLAWFKKYNLVMKAWVAQNLETPKILVSGHSHLPEINMQERFANSGSIKWGLGQYLILEDGDITLHDCRY